MHANSNVANRHDWWWMVQDCEFGPPAPHYNVSSWGGPSLAESITKPATALEAAYQLAMLPFSPILMAPARAEGHAAKPRAAPLVGNRMESDFKEPARACMERIGRHS